MTDRLIDRITFAQRLGISLRAFAQLRHDKKLPPAIRFGKRSVRWRESDVAAFISASVESVKGGDS
jgi:predicted DNA-binding transcriptional regulator AlpA